MATKTYTSNTLINFTVEIFDVDGNPVDATTLVAKVKTPFGDVLDISGDIVHDSTGNYHVPYLPTIQGAWLQEWIGTGSVEVAKVQPFIINPAIF